MDKVWEYLTHQKITTKKEKLNNSLKKCLENIIFKSVSFFQLIKSFKKNFWKKIFF